MFDGDNIYVAAQLLGQRAAREVDRQRAAPRHQPDAAERSLRRRLRHLLRSPQRLHVLRQPARRLLRLLGRRRRRAEHRLEPGVGRARPAASTAAGRSRCSSRSSRCATRRAPIRCGASSSAARSATRTSGPTGRRCRRTWPARRRSTACRRTARVVGLDLPPAGRNLELKPYALGKMTHRSPDESADHERQGRRHRRRREVRRHREPHRRPHRQHRLRAGRDRRAAGQPDALQPVPAREARVLPRGPRPVRLRPRRRRAAAAAIPAVGGGSSDTPYLFYTRRIGLNRNRVIPIDAGGRLTGKVGAFGVGVMNIQAGDEEVSRDAVAPTSPCCASSATSCAAAPSARCSPIATSLTSNAGGNNQAYGVDAALGFYQNVAIGGYYARTADDRRRRRQRELPGQVRLGAGSLRRERRSPEGREGLQSGSRLPAPHRLHALVRVGALQPAAEVVALRAQVHVAGELRVLRERRRRCRIAAGDRPLQRRVQQQRHLQRRGERQLRPAADAVFAGRRAT